MSEMVKCVFKKDDVVEEVWVCLLVNIEVTLKDEEFWETFGVGVFYYM